MKRNVILDTGPLVAMLNRRETQHAWVKEILADTQPPLLSCEAVFSEACFLLRGVGGQPAVMNTLNSRLVRLAFDLQEQAESVAELIGRFESMPMALADACLVRMSELYPESSVLTLDSDFRIYRKNRNQMIPVIMPDTWRCRTS